MMPRKIPFRVAFVSGEDEKFRARELNTHGPTVQGWHSPKFCIYPQEIIIQLESRVKICKIQVLSHQFLIATQIELLVGDIADSNTIVTPQNAVYERLGAVQLSDNERTNYKARELKSIHVDAIGIFVKFVIAKNHVNRHNLCNQVGVVAINVIGDVCDDKGTPGEEAVGGGLQSKNDFISPLDDLAFDMYQDPEVALIIRKLDAKKQKAVLDEQYDFARKLKNATSELHKAGEKLGKYEIEKRQAKEMEDFDKVKQKQQQMEEYRIEVYTRLELHKLIDDKVTSPTTSTRPEPAEKPFSPELHSAKNSRDSNEDDDVSNTFEDYENRMVPALRKRSGFEDELSDEDSAKALKSPKNSLSDSDRRQASLPIDVFGLKLVENAYSKNFSERIQSLKAIQRHLGEFNSAKSEVTTAKMFRASIFLILRALKDNVLTVFTQGINVVTSLLKKFPETNKVSKNDLSGAVDKVLPELINRSGDNSPRIRSAAISYILTMAEFPEVVSLHSVPSYCCRPIQSNVSPRLAQSRAEIVEQLVLKQGIHPHLTVDMVMAFCVPALEHPLGPVREIAEHLIVHLYRQRPKREIRKHLPPDDEKPRRNIIYRQLFEQLDKIDGQNVVKNGTKSKLSDKNKLTKQSAIQKPTKKKISTVETNNKPDDSFGMINLDELDRTCIFCGETNNDFDEKGLDIHYWKSCPMLVKCRYCKQVVEIASLVEHLLTECASKHRFVKCDRCLEAVAQENYHAHVKLNTCNPAKPKKEANRCPICHQNIPPGEESWKVHLIEINGCPYNCRRDKTKDDHPPPHIRDQAARVSDRASTLPRPPKKPLTNTRLPRSTSQRTITTKRR